MVSDRVRLISRAYQKALVELRQRHDDEFQSILTEKYEEMGIDVRKRKSRAASRREKNTPKEGTT